MRVALCFGLLLSVLGDPVSWGAAVNESRDQAGAAPLGFRRIFVPADRVTQWPIGPARYIPVEPDEFERLVGVLNSTPSHGDRAPAAHVVEADYHARLAGEALLVGRAELEFEKRRPGEELARLDPCNLAIHEAKWSSADAPAHVGSAPTGETVVLVREAGRLLLEWSARGSRDASGTARFQLELPRSSVGHLELELPEELHLVVVGGIVTEETPLPGQLRRWRIELGSQRRIDLAVSTRSATDDRGRLAMVRQRTTYDVSLRGLEVSAEIELDVHDEPLDRLELILDPSLTPVTVRYGDAELPWSLTPERETGGSRMVLEFAEPIMGTGRLLRVTASAPVVVGRSWQLPKVQPLQIHWQEGNVALRVRSPLSLVEFEGERCRQTGTSSLSAFDVNVEIIEVQMFDGDASIDVALAIDEKPLRVVSRTVVRLGGSQPIGRLIADLSSTGVPRFQLTASIGRDWTIDAVESDPPGSISQWGVESESGGSSQLTIQLLDPIRPNELKRLVLKGRRVAPVDGQPLQAGDLPMVHFHLARYEKRLIGLDVADAYRLELRNAERLRVIAAADLEAADVSPFDEVPDAILFDLQSADPELSVALVPKEPQFVGDLRLDADVTASHLVERYLISCTPLGSAIDTLEVRFSVPRESEPKWSVSASDRTSLRARRIDAGERGAVEGDASGETWMITLSEPASEPFQIRAVRTTPFAGDTALSLLSLPGAVSSSGEIRIHSLDGAPPRIQSHDVETLAVTAAGPERYTTARAAFRYDPLGNADPLRAPTVTLARPGEGLARSGAICWQCNLISCYEASGRGQHRVTYHLQNDGLGRLRLRLPPGANLSEVWVDGKKVSRRRQQGLMIIDLPSGRKFPTVTMELVTETRPWSLAGRAIAPLPTSPDVPLMGRRWTLWTPHEYQVTATSGSWTDVSPRAMTWQQRLFGPLARGQVSSSGEPIDARTRDQLAMAMGAGSTARTDADEFLERLGQAMSTAESGNSMRAMTWAELFRNIEPLRRRALLLDRDALAEAGVDPTTHVPGPSGVDLVSRGLSLLEKTNLALVVHPETLLLTSQTIAASHRHELVPVESSVVFRTKAGEIATMLDDGPHDPMRLVAMGDWDVSLRTPWNMTSTAGTAGLGGVGWRAHRFEGIGWPDPQETQFARVVRGTALGALTWIAMLLAAVVGWWWLNRRLGLFITIVLACGMIALILPTAYVAVASGVVLGLLFSLGLALLSPRRERAELQDSLGSPSKVPAGTVAVLILVATGALVPWAICMADEERATPDAIAVSDEIHRVLIPIDENREPTGDPYQVPEKLYQQMRSLADRAAGTPRGWLIERAVYRGRLVNQPGGAGTGLDRIRAQYDVHLFGGTQRIQLPLGDDVELSSISVQVDGRTVPVTAGSGGIEVPVDRPGAHRVEIELQLARGGVESLGGLRMMIPPVANSRLELGLPPKGPSVAVPTARGEVVLDEARQTLFASLGPTRTLEIRWHGEPDDGAGATGFEVEEMYWLRVEPGSVVVDAHLRYQVGDRSIDRLRLAVDPRLRLLTPDGANPSIAKRNVVPGDPTLLELELDRPRSGEFVLNVSFLLEGTSGVGNLRFPRIEVRGARSTRRWLGVSVSPALQHQISPPQAARTLSMADFIERWGQIDQPPEMVLRLPRGQTDWTLSTRPSMPAKSVQQRQMLSFGQSRVELVYQADLEIRGGPSFQHKFRAPRGLSIHELSLRESGVERPVRWVRDKDGRITVFLSGPMQRRQQIRLRGRLPRPAFGRAAVGLVSQLDAEIVSNRLTVFRRRGVLVSVEAARGVDPLEQPSGRSDDVLGRAVGDFALADDVETLALLLERNEPSLSATQLTSLEHVEGNWFARVECQLEVTGGVVDTLLFRLPDEFAGPLELMPSFESEIIELPAEDGRSLVVWPDEPITGRQRLVLRAPITPADRQPLRVPSVTLAEADRLDRYLLLPNEINREQLAWSTRAVVQATLPEIFGRSESDLEGRTCYRVAGQRFEAVLRSVEPAAAVPQIRLADIRIAWDQRGNCHGIAAFDLEPAGLDVCPLWLPSGWQVTGLWIETVPVSARRDAADRWLLDLNSGSQPQRIEVAFTGQVALRGSRRQPLQFSAPRLGELPVERTLWTLCAPPGTLEVELLAGNAIDPARLELARQQTAAGLFAQVIDAPATELEEQTAFRQEIWSRRLATSIARLRELARSSPKDIREQLEREAAWAHQEHVELLRRLPQRPGRSIPPAPVTVVVQTGEIWTRSTDHSHARTSCMFPGWRGTLPLTYRSETRHTEFARWSALAALVVLGGILLLVRARHNAIGVIRRYPQAGGVVVGLFWWLWLSPSPIGLLIVALSLVSAGRLGWRRRSQRGSSVFLLDAPSS